MAFRESLKIQIKWHRRNLLLRIILISRLKWLKVINICNNIGIVRWWDVVMPESYEHFGRFHLENKWNDSNHYCDVWLDLDLCTGKMLSMFPLKYFFQVHATYKDASCTSLSTFFSPNKLHSTETINSHLFRSSC